MRFITDPKKLIRAAGKSTSKRSTIINNDNENGTTSHMHESSADNWIYDFGDGQAHHAQVLL